MYRYVPGGSSQPEQIKFFPAGKMADLQSESPLVFAGYFFKQRKITGSVKGSDHGRIYLKSITNEYNYA